LLAEGKLMRCFNKDVSNSGLVYYFLFTDVLVILDESYVLGILRNTQKPENSVSHLKIYPLSNLATVNIPEGHGKGKQYTNSYMFIVSNGCPFINTCAGFTHAFQLVYLPESGIRSSLTMFAPTEQGKSSFLQTIGDCVAALNRNYCPLPEVNDNCCVSSQYTDGELVLLTLFFSLSLLAVGGV
jgi:hypothetical protein